jgi:hypothetical protein
MRGPFNVLPRTRLEKSCPDRHVEQNDFSQAGLQCWFSKGNDAAETMATTIKKQQSESYPPITYAEGRCMGNGDDVLDDSQNSEPESESFLNPIVH